MNLKSLVIGCVAVLTWVLAIGAQSVRQQSTPQATADKPATTPAQARPARPQPTTSAPAQVRTVATTTPATPAISADEQRAFFKTWCVGCHNQAAKATMDSSRKLQLDTLDTANVDKDRKTWELV